MPGPFPASPPKPGKSALGTRLLVSKNNEKHYDWNMFLGIEELIKCYGWTIQRAMGGVKFSGTAAHYLLIKTAIQLGFLETEFLNMILT